jgi:hypothetical protein
MKRCITFAVAALAMAALGGPAAGQGSGAAAGAPANSGGIPMGNHMGQNNMTQADFNKVVDYADEAKRLTKDDKAKGKTLKDLLAEDLASATALAKSMPLSCDVTQAMLAAQGPVTVDGKTVDTKTYEATCANGMGYFLISQQPGKPYGFSCFAADATRAADAAAGRPPGAVCQLPPNANVKTAMATVLSRAGTNCTVRDLKWVGVSNAASTEFNEIACNDGNGYILRTALPGSMAQPRVVTCLDSIKQGLPCKLTAVAAASVVTVQTFRDALAAHKVICTASDSNVRAIGQQTASKRYVVEFQCPEQPKGLVAFIPLNGNTAPFETLNCVAAAKKGAACKLTAN